MKLTDSSAVHFLAESPRLAAYNPSTPLQSTAQAPPRRTNRGSQTWVRSDSNPGPPLCAADTTTQQMPVAGVQNKPSTDQLYTVCDQSSVIQPAGNVAAWSPGIAEVVAALRATAAADDFSKQTDPVHDPDVLKLSDVDVQVSAVTPAQSLSVQNVDSMAGAESNEGHMQPLCDTSVQTVSTLMPPPPLLSAQNVSSNAGTDLGVADPHQLSGSILPSVLSLVPPQPFSAQQIIHLAETTPASGSSPLPNLPGTCLVPFEETPGKTLYFGSCPLRTV